MLNTLASIYQGGAGGAGGSFESIATQVLSSSTTTVTFSSIPSTYKHLQLRVNFLTSGIDNAVNTFLNNDSTNGHYACHAITNNNTTPYAWAISSTNNWSIGYAWGTNPSPYPNVFIMDVIDYANSSKYKTGKIMWGTDSNYGAAHAEISFASGLWLSTAAINQISFNSGITYLSGSTFALYGING